MKTLCGITVIGLVLLLGTVAWAGVVVSIDGNRLLRDCGTAIQLLEAGYVGGTVDTVTSSIYCMGYVTGTLEMAAYSSVINKTPWMFCLPDGMEFFQAIRIIVRYLQTHPERLHGPGAALVTEAMYEAFPCAPGASPPQR
jgi:hypothetical protein